MSIHIGPRPTDYDDDNWDDAHLVRAELEQAIDTLETYWDEPARAAVVRSYSAPVALSRLAQRLYELSESVETLALALWAIHDDDEEATA
jgi:hypothetical protein